MSNREIYREYGLNVRHPLVTPDSAHYRIPVWPPSDDWPVVIDHMGKVICRVGDPVWDMAAYGKRGHSARINFGYGIHTTSVGEDIKVEIDPTNMHLFQQCMCWFLWGHRQRLTANTVCGYAARLKPLFLLCAKEKIAASDLYRFPRVVDQLASTVAPSTADAVLTMLRELWTVRDLLGFVLLDERGMAHFEAGLPDHAEQQTPYIPPRIWLYQMQRLHAFLDEFSRHKEQIVSFFRYVHSACLDNVGSPEGLYSGQLKAKSPFNKGAEEWSSCRYHGTFFEVAEQFGIKDLLDNWTWRVAADDKSKRQGGSMAMLASYFRATIFVGHKYLLNLSGARSDEGANFRESCFVVEHDDDYGDLFLLRGETTKTIGDDNALWVTSPSAKLAVDAMATVARLRLECAQINPFVQIPEDEIADPWLLSKPREPWTARGNANGGGRAFSKSFGYGNWESVCPALFDEKELTITEEDIRIARLVTPTLDPERYAVGKVWYFRNHQLRRTTAVNMCASNLVSWPSLQYQLKHMRRAQSLYYGRGFSHVALNRRYAEEYLRTAYEMLRRQVAQLADDRYVSPLGAAHKSNMLERLNPYAREEPINKRDIGRMQKLLANGEVAAKPTLLGLCMSPIPCEWGGVLNIIHCSDCDRALGDRRKLPEVKEVRRMIKENLDVSPPDSPDRESLELQLKSAEKFIHVLRS